MFFKAKTLKIELAVDLYAGGVDGRAAFYHLGKSYSPFFPAELLRSVRFPKNSEYPVIYLDGDCTVRERRNFLCVSFPRFRGRSQLGRVLYPHGFRLVIPKSKIKSYSYA